MTAALHSRNCLPLSSSLKWATARTKAKARTTVSAGTVARLTRTAEIVPVKSADWKDSSSWAGDGTLAEADGQEE